MLPTKTKTISFSLALLVLLCLQAQAFSLLNGSSLRKAVLNTQATSSGVIELKKDSYGDIYVEADLSSDSSSFPNRQKFWRAADVPKTLKMMVSISNNETMLTAGCLDFNNFHCSESNHCSQKDLSRLITYPYFMASTKAAQANLCLDDTYWSVPPSFAYLYVSYSCFSGNVTRIGAEKDGVIGLGTTGDAKYDFTQSEMFSIYIKPDLSGGKLLFKNETSTYAESSKPVYTLYTNSTWQLPLYVSGAINIGNYSVSLNRGNLMFDINTDVIALPYRVFIYFVNYFAKTLGGTCDSSEYYRPICNFTGEMKDLPDVTISFVKYSLTIPPAVYASVIDKGENGSSFYFNFKATDPALSEKSAVMTAYQNAVILGTHFMKYYFTVFDASSGLNTVYLYKAKEVVSS